MSAFVDPSVRFGLQFDRKDRAAASDKTGDKASPGYWLMIAATLGIIAALTVYRGGRTIATREAVAA